MTQVSIIIPTYNRAQLIAETLDSVRKQSYTDWECIVVDDGSTDNTWEVLSRYASEDNRFRICRRPPDLPKGAPSCRNYGFSIAKGELIQWFDSDDLMLPEMLSKKVNALARAAEAEFVVAKMGEFSIGDDVQYRRQVLLTDNVIIDFLKFRIRFFTPGPMFRRSFLQGKELFDTRLRRHQEWEFFTRLLMEGRPYVTLDEYLCLRRIHTNSIKGIISEKDEKIIYYQAIVSMLRHAINHRKTIFFQPEVIRFYKAWSRSAIKFFFSFLHTGFLRFFFQIRSLLRAINEV